MSDQGSMSSGTKPPPTSPTLVFPRAFRDRRRKLPWAVRHLIVIVFAVLVSVAASYSLRYLGY